jgi:hypothetical protein
VYHQTPGHHLAIIITIMSLKICNKVREKMPSTTFISDAQKSSKNIITSKELGLKDQAKVGVLRTSGKRLLENQKLQNWMKDLILQNKRLMTNLPPTSVTYYFLREQSHKIFVSIRTKTNYVAHSRPSVTWMYQGVSCNNLAHMVISLI